MKKIALTALMIGAILLIIGIVAPMIIAIADDGGSESISIIGGADGPTAVYIHATAANGLFAWLTFFGSVLAPAGIIALIVVKIRSKNRQ